MNPVEHHAIVDRGLKMKIKRKNVGALKGEGVKHEILKNDNKLGQSVTGTISSVNMKPVTVNTNLTQDSNAPMSSPTTLDKLKQTLQERDRLNNKTSAMANSHSPGRTSNKKEKVKGEKSKPTLDSLGAANGGLEVLGASSNASGVSSLCTSGSMTSGIPLNSNNHSSLIQIKQEPNTPSDPYEFNAKVEDRIGLPVKKVKQEKMDCTVSPDGASEVPMETGNEHKDASTETNDVSTATDPDCLGPCEPGTSVVLEGIVWNETENGILVVNITWRGKTYVGTLMDATKHAWAPPRFNCDSPAVDAEARTPRGRGKRGRAAVTPPVVDLGERRLRKRRNNNTNPYAAPPSPAKSENNGPKRRARPADLDLDLDNIRTTKRARTSTKNGNATTPNSATPENGFIECPEPNCSKKYRHINGLRYHQAHAHKNDYVDEEMDTKDLKLQIDEATNDSATSPNNKGRGRKPSNSTTQPENNLFDSSTADVKPENTPKGKKVKKEDKVVDICEKSMDKQLDKQPTVALTPVSVENIKTKPVTTASLNSVSTTVQSDSSVQASTTVTTSSVPVTMTVTSSPSKPKKSKNDKEKKGKVVVAQTILPSALPTSLPAVTTAPVTNGTGSTGLKPIQPKPTVLGETNSVNPALSGLKEKKSKKKKNKSKDKEKDKSGKNKDNASKDVKPDISKIPNLVSDSQPLPPSSGIPASMQTNKPLEALVKMSTPPELQKQGNIQTPGNSSSDKPTGSPPELQKQMPLSKLPSPVKGHRNGPHNSHESKDDNAQSPAYSDISDANDSCSNLDGDSILNSSKAKDNDTSECEPQDGAKSQVLPTNDQKQGQGFNAGLYKSYQYPQSQYLSPTTSSNSENAEMQSTPKRKESDVKNNAPVDGITKSGVKPSEGPKNLSESEGGAKANPSPSHVQEYRERMLRAQQYQHYMAAYGYGVDVRLLASNPEYKAQYDKWLMDQERMRREYQMSRGADGRPNDMPRPMEINNKAIDLSKQGKGSPASKPSATITGPEMKHSPIGPKPDGNLQGPQDQDRKMNDKMHENHPRDGSKSNESQSGVGYPPGYDRQQEEYRRYYMFQQQQRMMEHKRYMEQQHQGKTDGDKKPPMSPALPRSDAFGKSPKDGRPIDIPNSFSKGSPLARDNMHNNDSKLDKNKMKPASTRPGSDHAPSPTGTKPKDGHDPYRRPQGYPPYPYDPSQGGYPQGVNPIVGYASSPNSYPPYPPHRSGSFPGTPDSKDSKGTPSPGAKSSAGPPQEGKALELLQQKAANFYRSHSPQTPQRFHELKTRTSSPGRDLDRTMSPSPAGKDSKRSPPPQRHVHTHHHTHMLQGAPAYSLYGPYGASALMASQQAAAAAASTVSNRPSK